MQILFFHVIQELSVSHFHLVHFTSFPVPTALNNVIVHHLPFKIHPSYGNLIDNEDCLGLNFVCTECNEGIAFTKQKK